VLLVEEVLLEEEDEEEVLLEEMRETKLKQRKVLDCSPRKRRPMLQKLAEWAVTWMLAGSRNDAVGNPEAKDIDH
jgi:hypothetical protein